MSIDPLVEKQYEKWIYPEPLQDLEVLFKQGRFMIGDPAKYHDQYWPDMPYIAGMNILVAGCGANEAAMYAYCNPSANVVGIDLSQASLNNELLLKERHKLDNLTLERLPIEHTDKLDQEFDLIISSGVLHHTNSPEGSLRKLKDVLKLNGVIRLMLYGKYGRTGVYQMQELFRLLNLEQDQEGLDLVDATLTAIDDQHFVKSYIKHSTDLAYPGGRVDTFLHKRDRAYTVGDCLALADACDLKFIGWQNNRLYYPDATLSPKQPLYKKLNQLPDQEIWKAMELFHGRISKHEFLLCRNDRPENNWLIKTTQEPMKNYIPVMFPGQIFLTNLQRQEYSIKYLPYPNIQPIRLTPIQGKLALHVNGKNTVKECASLTGNNSESQLTIAIQFFRSLWRLGLISLRTAPAQ
jgi:SAM-dependent methyltransferase